MILAMGCASKAPATPAAYCRKCDYALAGLPAKHQCPECGRAFDLSDPKTFRRRPRRKWWRIARWFVYPLLLVSLIFGGCIGWCYWEWKREQPVIAWASQQRNGFAVTRPIGPDWLQKHAGRWRWMLERVDRLYASDVLPRKARQISFSRLGHIQRLFLSGPLSGPSGIDNALMSEIGQLRGLQDLSLVNSSVTDEGLFYLSGCRSLQELEMRGSPVGIKGLHSLHGPKLIRLDLSGTETGDDALHVLKRMTKLQWLNLWPTSVSPAAAAELKRALPNCRIVGPDGNEVQP